MPFEMIYQDITTMKTDAIVNAANRQLKQGGGVCGAIFRAAGPELLQAECDAIGYCAVGDAVITNGYQLDARYIIHTVGPVWQGRNQQEAELLASCYRKSLELAVAHQLESISFPLISAGIFGYPKEEAKKIATQTIQAFLTNHDLSVYLVLFD